MDDPRLFRRHLAARILGLVGVATIALPQACSGAGAGGATGTGGAATTGSSAGGAGTTATTGTRSSTSTGGSGPGLGGSLFSGGGGSSFFGDGGFNDAPATIMDTICFDWPLDVGAGGAAADAGPPPDPGPCPADQATIILDYTQNICPSNGWDPIV